jgi:hypothetical protein
MRGVSRHATRKRTLYANAVAKAGGASPAFVRAHQDDAAGLGTPKLRNLKPPIG